MNATKKVEKKIDDQGNAYLEVNLSSRELLFSSLLNKGMGFTEKERDEFKLNGLIPYHQASLSEQQQRSYEAFKSKTTDAEKYLYLRDLQDSNEVLFYSLLTSHISEMLPIVYTPVVGLGCQRFSHNYRRPRGLFIAYPDKDRIDEILSSPYFDNVEAIVVSDGERILGLGDQGAGGMGIPIGKLALYSACAGIHPVSTLPILLDTGTNNQDLINDPLYIGWHHERVRGQDYDDFIEAFVTAIKKRFPHVLLQWEDFAQQNANPILAKYRDQLCTFNDDIQGTAAIATGTLLAAINVTGLPLKEQRIAIVGGGSAGCGIGHLLAQAMMEEGLSEEEAYKRFYIVDRFGLLLDTQEGLMDFQKVFTHTADTVASWSCENPKNVTLLDVFKNAKPTVLIGVSGQAGIFTEEIVRLMASYADRPVIFPLSNPTDHSEAKPEDLMKWTDGRVLMGTGSPFPEIMKNGRSTRVDQTNNAYIFPGMGLGLIAVKATKVTDKMFMLAAKALADCSPTKNDSDANLLPSLESIRAVSVNIALAVAKEAVDSGLAAPECVADWETLVKTKVWNPVYLPYVSA